MQAKTRMGVVALTIALTLSGCAADKGDATDLMRLRSKGGPDEFAILPPKALEMPTSLNDLPAPTPGGANRTDQRPLDDAVVALGGRPGATGGIPAADSALYAHAARLGRQDDIRSQLASEDLEWRRDNRGRILERMFSVNTYYRAYRNQSLDQHGELDYWRSRGLLTPSAPPEGYDKKAEEKKKEKEKRGFSLF
ncbi:DUF3035 domain-containing protein [Xinfangfangia sp. D13-10-4-6]|uniref:DUF3035 domain-containing protein n=1 Tax=Pseudogemmobacter hezensis TaxID=2737662 RepID=UPI0015578E46|nr:DUF3035 domain-containing protein [Pseudogemmobacter hezensis]NPD13887.1 DUF3035 domain-containing protein [Pseudogemmobacter hezensis]